MNGNCDRCGNKTNITTMSMFNRQMVCLPCKHEEKLLPEYVNACKVELEEVRKGNMNFEGVGLPARINNS